MHDKARFRQFQQRPVSVQPPPPKPRRSFRWWLLWLPLAVVLAVQLVTAVVAVVSSFSWSDILNRLSIRDKPGFSSLAALACVCLAIVALAKILGYGKKEWE